MADEVKSIITIDVNSEQFQELARLIDSYRDKLKQLPGDWAKVARAATDAARASSSAPAAGGGSRGASAGGSGGSAADAAAGAASRGAAGSPPSSAGGGGGFMGGGPPISPFAGRIPSGGFMGGNAGGNSQSLAVMAMMLATMPRQMENTNQAAQRGTPVFREMARVFREIETSVGNTAFHIAKWAALGGVVGIATGGLGAGGLAGAATALRGTARSLRVSPGQLRAAQTNFGNYFDVEGVLGNIGAAQTDLTKRGYLAGLGVTGAKLNESPAELLPELLPRILAKMRQGGMNQQAYSAMGLDNILDFQTAMGLSRLPAGELQGATQRYQQDTKGLGLNDNTLSAWQSLQQQFQRAGYEIENSLIRGLVKLSPHLEHLSGAIAHAFEAFEKNPNVGKWIDDFGDGIEKAAKYLNSPDFQTDMKQFVADAGTFVRVLGFLARAGTKAMEGWDKILGWTKVPDKDTAYLGWTSFAAGDYLSASTQLPAGTFLAAMAAKIGGHAPDKGMLADSRKYLTGLETKYGLPAGVLDRVWAAESGRGQNLVSGAGALGPFQFMPSSIQQYGVQNPFDFFEEGDAAARKFKDLLREYKGDVKKSLAAYNLGDSRLNSIIAQHPNDWTRYVPRETSDYLSRTVGPTSPGLQVSVNVHDTTGGSSNINSSQLVH